jgi:hypothetical protein
MKINAILCFAVGLFISAQAIAQTTPGTTDVGMSRREWLANSTPVPCSS